MLARIAPQFLGSVVYLYPSESAAKDGVNAGGSGFIAGVTSEAFPSQAYLYAVTNKHVVEDGESRTIRLNTKDGKTDIRPGCLDDWTRSAVDDLAVRLISLEPSQHKFIFVSDDFFLTPELIERLKIGPGDEAFMVGRFINHEGRQCNTPSVRFGNIAMMPGEPVRRADGSMQDSFLVDMRSVSGYSGSPAFIFIRPEDMHTRRIQHDGTTFRRYTWFLGVDWGHMPIWRDLLYKADKTPYKEALGINSNSGMAGVVPAWRLSELFKDGELLAQRRELDKKLRKEAVGQLDVASEDTFTKKDFESALQKVSRKLPRDPSEVKE